MSFERMSVWLDADLCSGCGVCVDVAPEVFEHVDGLSHVKDEQGNILESMGVAFVPFQREKQVIEAVEGCPGEIIYTSRAAS